MEIRILDNFAFGFERTPGNNFIIDYVEYQGSWSLFNDNEEYGEVVLSKEELKNLAFFMAKDEMSLEKEWVKHPFIIDLRRNTKEDLQNWLGPRYFLKDVTKKYMKLYK